MTTFSKLAAALAVAGFATIAQAGPLVDAATDYPSMPAANAFSGKAFSRDAVRDAIPVGSQAARDVETSSYGAHAAAYGDVPTRAAVRAEARSTLTARNRNVPEAAL
jgi:hypothetical protein